MQNIRPTNKSKMGVSQINVNDACKLDLPRNLDLLINFLNILAVAVRYVNDSYGTTFQACPLLRQMDLRSSLILAPT